MCYVLFQTRGSTLDLKNEQKGLLWILDEESIFPGANDSSFLARLYVHHCSESELSGVCCLDGLPTGLENHGKFLMIWKNKVLQKSVEVLEIQSINQSNQPIIHLLTLRIREIYIYS